MNRIFMFFILLNFSCNTENLTIIADFPNSLKEVSAVEISSASDLFWVIEDAGNDNKLYGLNIKGKIVKELKITNAQNIDWEDLTTDENGNIYIGDFGNNTKNRLEFTIYKIGHSDLAFKAIKAESITFNFGMNCFLMFESYLIFLEFILINFIFSD